LGEHGAVFFYGPGPYLDEEPGTVLLLFCREVSAVRVERVLIDRINPAAYNPRKDLQPGDPEYDKLKTSIERFGFVEPLVWNERSGNLVGGHQRFKILVARGDTEIEVSVVDLDEAEERALNVALNKIEGEWDQEKLRELLAGLE